MSQKGFLTLSERSKSKGFAGIGILVVVLILAGLVGVYYFGKLPIKPRDNPKACTQEAKQCPDGSYVGRTGSNCEFAPCPSTFKLSLPEASQSSSQPSENTKKDSYTESTSVPNQKRYVSPKLGVSFLYLSVVEDGQKINVKEVDQKIYVYPSNTLYQDGQFVEVFNKDKTDTLAEAIRKQFLKGVSEKSCFVVIDRENFKSYPKNYSTAEISYPKTGLMEIPAACPANYSETMGIRYFLGDSKHPEIFLFISIGQYGIEAGEGKKLWQDTIQFLD